MTLIELLTGYIAPNSYQGIYVKKVAYRFETNCQALIGDLKKHNGGHEHYTLFMSSKLYTYLRQERFGTFAVAMLKRPELEMWESVYDIEKPGHSYYLRTSDYRKLYDVCDYILDKYPEWYFHSWNAWNEELELRDWAFSLILDSNTGAIAY